MASWPFIGGSLARLESGKAPEERASSENATDALDKSAKPAPPRHLLLKVARDQPLNFHPLKNNEMKVNIIY